MKQQYCINLTDQFITLKAYVLSIIKLTVQQTAWMRPRLHQLDVASTNTKKQDYSMQVVNHVHQRVRLNNAVQLIQLTPSSMCA